MAVVHLAVGRPAESDGHDGGQQEHEVVADRVVADVGDPQGLAAGRGVDELAEPGGQAGAMAMTANRMTRMPDCRKANVRPRVSSSTSRPTTVYPVT